MRVIINILFLASSIFQFFACIAGVDYTLNMGDFVSFILAIVLTWIPVVGAVFGVIGAHNVWHWGLYTSIFLFIWPMIFTFVLILLGKGD